MPRDERERPGVERGVLDLVEYIVLRVDADGRPTARSPAADALLDALAPAPAAVTALFGLADYAALVARADVGEPLFVEVPLRTREVRLKWGVYRVETPAGPAVECVSANWAPLLDMVRAFERETLLFKELALNIFPRHIADELVDKRAVRPRAYRHATIVFTDVVGFSRLAFHLDPVTLVRTLNGQFSAFDELMDDYGMEKIKTIGDAYMCVSGVPVKKKSHAVDAALAALEMVRLITADAQPPKVVGGIDVANWQIRVGLHTGPCITGVVGHKKHVYDVWGDSVNVAARMESASEPMRVNISKDTHDEVADWFECTHRGAQAVKNIGEVEMYFLDRLRPEYSADARGLVPNEAFYAAYIQRFRVRESHLAALPKGVRAYFASR